VKFLKKILFLFFVIFFINVPTQIKTYPHIPLKGLFNILKIDDIGFGHALLHSRWIENIYQYGDGKAPSKENEWKGIEGIDPIVNLVRKLWFRYEENYQLLPTKKGDFASIRDNQLGVVFGKLMNCVYKGFDKESKKEFIYAMFPGTVKEVKKYSQELNNPEFDEIRKAERILVKETLPKIMEKIGADKGWDPEVKFVMKQERKKAFANIPQYIQNKYNNIKIKQIQSRTNLLWDLANKLLQPIKQAFEFCKKKGVYLQRTTEGILWAIFFHRIDKMKLQGQKIQAINNCLFQIDNRFKNKDFQDNKKLTVLYGAKKDLDDFEERIKGLSVCKQLGEMAKNYDLALNFLLYVLAGKFPPLISQGRYGYEYAKGEISEVRPNCYEVAMHYLLSILWYNPEEKIYDNTLFPTKVIQDGKGFKRFRDALKYFYLATGKKIGAQAYTSEFVIQDKSNKPKLVKFTSLLKLKDIIPKSEIVKLRIADIPVQFINTSEVEQEVMNIVSNLSGIKYEQDIKGVGFELTPSVQNFITLCNYFYGTEAESLEELGNALSTENREIIFEKKDEKDAPNEIKITVKDKIKGYSFDVTVDIKTRHVTLDVPGRETSTSDILKKGFAKILLSKVITKTEDSQEEEEEGESEKEKETEARNSNILTLLTSKELLTTSDVTFTLPILNLIYYSLILEKPKVKLAVIKDILRRHVKYYESLKGLLHNLIEKFPADDPYLTPRLNAIILVSGAYKKDPILRQFLEKSTVEKLLFDGIRYAENEGEALLVYLDLIDKVEDINKGSTIVAALSNGYNRIVKLIKKRKEFDFDKNTQLFNIFTLSKMLDRGYKDIALRIMKKRPGAFKSQAILISAIDRGYKDIVRRILYEMPISSIYQDAVRSAIEQGHEDIVFQMLKGHKLHPRKEVFRAIIGFAKNKKNMGLLSLVLIAASKEGYQDIATELLSFPNIKINVRDYDGYTPLMWAAWEGHKEIVGLLLTHPRIKMWLKADRMTALEHAKDKNHWEIVRMLKECMRKKRKR